ncbi:hypothetical protein TSMEX_004311 [Taenia solium]|eukprot:TsM_000297300 transcript=TsM_000297300 gene=TsM_000297300
MMTLFGEKLRRLCGFDKWCLCNDGDCHKPISTAGTHLTSIRVSICNQITQDSGGAIHHLVPADVLFFVLISDIISAMFLLAKKGEC